MIFVIFIFACNNKPSKSEKKSSSYRSSHIDDNKNTLSSKSKNITKASNIDKSKGASHIDDNKNTLSSKSKNITKASNIDKSKGAYLYYDNHYKTHILFIYIKLSKDKLKNAVFPPDDPKNIYITASFVNGIDYVGHDSYENIKMMINDAHMINILTHNYKEVHKTLRNLEVAEFNEHVSFSKEQLKNK